MTYQSGTASLTPRGIVVPSRFHPLQDTFQEMAHLLKRTKSPNIDTEGCLLGRPTAFVPLIRHCLCEFNRGIAVALLDKYGLSPTNEDRRFLENSMRILREEFHGLPPLTLQQFWTTGFAQKKMELVILIARGVLARKQNTHFNQTVMMRTADKSTVSSTLDSNHVQTHEDSDRITLRCSFNERAPPSPTVISQSLRSSACFERRVVEEAVAQAVANATRGLEERLMKEIATLSARINIIEMQIKLNGQSKAVEDVTASDAMDRILQKIKQTENLLSSRKQ